MRRPLRASIRVPSSPTYWHFLKHSDIDLGRHLRQKSYCGTINWKSIRRVREVAWWPYKRSWRRQQVGYFSAPPVLFQVEQEEEAKYARQFRVDGETHAAQGIDRKRAFVEKQKAYACILQEQVSLAVPS